MSIDLILIESLLLAITSIKYKDMGHNKWDTNPKLQYYRIAIEFVFHE